MKDPIREAARLLDALDDFVGQEGVLLRAGAYAQLAALQDRVNPLVREICVLGSNGRLCALWPRIKGLIARRRELLSGLASRKEDLIARQRQLSSARERLELIRPYVRATAPTARRRLNAAV